MTAKEMDAEIRGKAVSKPAMEPEGSGVAGEGRGGEGHPNIKYGWRTSGRAGPPD